jgi:hypothetical protein
MDAPPQPADDPALPRLTRRAWLRLGVRATFVGLFAAAAGELGSVFVGDNFHTILPGQFYRCSQPSPEQLEQLIRRHGIRTVVNLRGPCPSLNPSFAWYWSECRKSAALDVCQEDLCFSAGRLPAVPEVRRLVEVLDRSERPLLFHCHRGADRTGLASVVAMLLYGDVSYEDARRQLGLRYGHITLGRPANLDRFFDLYGQWLRHEGLAHSRDNFRRWIERDYCPGECRAVIEPLDMPRTVFAGEPFGATVRCHNTSVKPWHFRPGTTSGIHAYFVVSDERAAVAAMGQAGLFDAEVAPGASIDLTLPVPALRRPGRYTMMVDMIDEQHCNFVQTGSEPLEWEFEVREQETAAGR